jgi:hypothetical protein
MISTLTILELMASTRLVSTLIMLRCSTWPAG